MIARDRKRGLLFAVLVALLLFGSPAADWITASIYGRPVDALERQAAAAPAACGYFRDNSNGAHLITELSFRISLSIHRLMDLSPISTAPTTTILL